MSDCSCKKCKSACQNKPGWFLPTEIKPLAEKMGLTVKQLFDKHLAVDWWEGDEISDHKTVYVLSPATTKITAGGMFGSNPSGVCQLFKDGKCSIHYQGKPRECAAYMHDDEDEQSTKTRHEIVKAWNTPENQQWVVDLLGNEPQSSSLSVMDAIFSGVWP